ncbi:hypothetical protein KGY71_07545, partial [Candidatus Bipolaricaulota bacterium]|nr:hypothetical protein [Candidatus Bipolaricaulota bacterium]
MTGYRTVPIILLVALFTLPIPVTAFGSDNRQELSVSFEEELTFSRSENFSINSETLLTIETSVSGVDFESKTEVGGNDSPGLSRQELNFAYEVDRFSSSLEAVFDPPRAELDYLLQQGKLETEDLELTNLLLLEKLSDEDIYGAGFEVGFSGTTAEGTGLRTKIRFGMDEYLREVHDPTVRGSGYYIITDHGADPSAFPFGSALIEISDVGLGPCTITNRTKFMRGEGLLFSGFSFDLIDQPPWKTRSYVFFSGEGETVTLVPTFEFGEGVWNVVADFGGKLEGEATALEKLELHGVKLNELYVGDLELSATSTLAGKMKKEKGEDTLELRAEDYKLARSFGEIARNYLFEEVDWSDVLTLEYDYLNKEDLRRYLAFDWYFKQGNTMNFLNVNTINAVSRWLSLFP